jgi:hypothetical protein
MKLRHLVDADLKAGLGIGLCIGAVLLALIFVLQERRPAPAPPLQPATTQALRQLELGGEAASLDVRRLAQWVVDSGDHGGRSFALVDKRHAKVFLFEADGRLAGATPVLLGFAVGDDTAPGVAAKPLSALRPEERTTPAGRFVSQAGRNADNEDVVWVDYAAAVSMHRVRPMRASERRLQRLASPTVDDNRISSGCINVPVAFFEQLLWPRLGSGRQGVVYVLPETRPLDDVFPALRPALPAG